MPKRLHYEVTSSNDGDEQALPAKIAKATSVCEYCSKTFTSRGMSLHQKKCSKKLALDQAEAKKTRSYKFCILNESIHEEILSFLSNQTLTKMEMLTGDHYDGCEPELAKICCKCENDNFTIGCFLCRQCIQSWPSYRKRVTKTMANKFYGVRVKDLDNLPFEDRGSSCLYERVTLEKFMLKTCGSKKEWLRHLVTVRARWNKAEAAQSRRQRVYDFLWRRAPELARSVKTGHYKDLDMKDKEQWYPRFEALKAAFCECGLLFLGHVDSTPCKDYIKNGIGSIQDVVNGVRHD
ncbi:hypothetical protein V7S43_005273 [Phytophthora oleae]|uniref:C2H2-type domain-containing protein n=1 Tax=Phytophthora oleae TaxID=2107226 RepID=A0ABD3FT43_9STRA